MKIKYSTDFLLEQVRMQAEKEGHSPTASSFKYAGVAVTRFGTWNAFLEQAGLKSRKSIGGKSADYSKDDLIKIIKEQYHLNGKVTPANDFEHTSAVIRLFGTYNTFLKEADLSTRDYDIPKKELIAEINHIYKMTGKIPLATDFERYVTATTKFGSWREFIDQAGLDVNEIQRGRPNVYSTDFLIKEVRELAKILQRVPKVSEYKYYKVIYRNFGSWPKFLITAGLERPENRCTFCGKEVKRKGNKFCSRKCYTKSKQNIKECVVCGKSFAEPPSSEKVCCSPSCGKKHRQQLQLTGAYDKANQKWLAEKEKYFADHKGDKHPNAKYWKIKSPTGKTYETVNLKEFIRQNIELFDGSTVRQAFDGIVKIKASEQGKRKRPVKSYKGWTLLDWKD